MGERLANRYPPWTFLVASCPTNVSSRRVQSNARLTHGVRAHERQSMKGSPLISRSPRKLYIALVLVVAGGALVCLPASIASSAFAIQLTAAGVVMAVVGLLGLWLLPTCPHCGLRLFPHAISSQNASDWLRWMVTVSTCPRCGHAPVDERSELQPALAADARKPSRLKRGVRQNGEHPLTTERRGYVRYICVCEQCQSPSDHTR